MQRSMDLNVALLDLNVALPETTWLDNFPSDVQVEILKRIPLKELIRLMSTCRSIFSFISSPNLLTTTTVRNTGYHIYYCGVSGGNQRFVLCRDTDKGLKIGRDGFTSIGIDPTYNLVGSCYGLLCFAKTLHSTNSNIVLWNPFLGKSLMLPTPFVASGKSCALGFGFDHLSLDFKLVRIGLYNSASIRADVHVVRTATWKKVVGSLSGPASEIMGQGIYLNGVVHWVIKFSKSDNDQDCKDFSILTFDLAKEVFAEIDIVEEIAHKSIVLTTLTLCGQEKLAMYHDDRVCDVWVMEEYGVKDSWRKLCSIPSDDSSSYVYSIKVLHARMNGDIVVSKNTGKLVNKKDPSGKFDRTIVNYTGGLLSYNPQTQESMAICASNSQPDYVGPYMASLVFLEQNEQGGAFCGKRVVPTEADDSSERKKNREKMEVDRANNSKRRLVENILGLIIYR